MFRLKKIGNIELDDALFLQETDEKFRSVNTAKFNAIDGSVIIFDQANKDYSYTFASNELAWNHESVVEALKSFAFNKTSEFMVQLESRHGDMVQHSCVFDYSSGEAIRAEPIFEGSEYYFLEIKLIKVG